MRQSGLLAAMGLVGLDEMTTRLHEDHDRAQQLARGEHPLLVHLGRRV